MTEAYTITLPDNPWKVELWMFPPGRVVRTECNPGLDFIRQEIEFEKAQPAGGLAEDTIQALRDRILSRGAQPVMLP